MNEKKKCYEMETSTQNQKEEEEKKTDLSQDPKNFTFYLRFFFFR